MNADAARRSTPIRRAGATTTTTVKRILVATDFGESSAKAVSLAVELANALKSALTLIHVVDVYPVYGYEFELPVDLQPQLESAGKAALAKELARIVRAVPQACGTLKTGFASEAILAFAKEDATDLLVVGTHGYRGVKRVLLGSVAEKLVRLSPVPVLTVHAGPHTR